MKWSKEHEAVLKRLWVNASCQEIANILGRSEGSIFNKKRCMGLENKTEERFLSMCAKLEKEGKNKMDKVKNTFKFRKGQKVKIRVKRVRKSKIIKGKVLFDSDYILTIKGPEYNETINKIDLFTEDAILL